MEVPLLFESHLDDFADDIIYVDASLDVRKQRVEKRDKEYSKLLKINKDYDEANKKKATHIVVNNKGIAELKKSIKTIYGK